MLRRVRTVLSGDGEPLDAEELLDALWLAGRLPPAAATALARVAAAAGPSNRATVRRDEAAPAVAAPRPSDEDRQQTTAPDTDDGPTPRETTGTGLHAAPAARRRDAHSDRAAMAVRAPGVKALGGEELRLGRALRPLKQLRPDALRTEVDIDATVTAMAETGLPEVVLRPATTKWLDLAVLVDDGVSMLLWQRLAGELLGLLQRCGAFRHVRVHGLDTRGEEAPRLSGRPYDSGDATLPMSTVLDPSGNTLLLVVSDGVGRAWRDGSMHDALLRAASAGPTALVHALPRRLWAGTGIDVRQWKVTTRRRGAANRSWDIEDPVLPAELAPYEGVPVPVLTTDDDSVGTWARLIGSPGDSAVLPLLAFPATATGTGTYGSHRGRPSDAEQVVLRFRDTASPEAYRLAAHLAAVAPVPVPVMRLVQHAMTPPVDTSHLAEVFLGGLMHGADETECLPHQKTFDFAEETRQILLGTVPPPELMRTTRAVTAHLGDLAGSPAGFPAWLPHPEGADRVRSGARQPFGWVDDTLKRRLGVSSPEPSEPAAPPPRPGEELRELPPGFELDPELTDWRRLTVMDPRFGGRGAPPYDVFAEHEGGWSSIGMFLAHDGEGRVLVIRMPGRPHAEDLVTREVAALKRMDGVHAPRLTAWDVSVERPWLAVECALDGTSEPAPNLVGFTRHHGLLHHAGLLAVARQLAGALTRAHEARLTHGSLTPRSVLIAGRDALITGWMTASLDGRPSPHRSRHRQHSAYRAPEMTDGVDAPSPEADVYALGCVLVAAATGPDYEGSVPDALAAVKGRLEPAFVGILRACLQPDPARRPTAGVLLQALDSLALEGDPGRHPLTVVLGFDTELNPVRLALESEHRGGQGPHLLGRGGPARARRELLRRVLEQLTRQALTGIELLLADFDGRSGLEQFIDRVSGSSFLGMRDDSGHEGTGALALCARLLREIERRREVLERATGYHDIGVLEQEAAKRSFLPRLPRLVVAVEDFPRIMALVPELRTALRQVAESGARLGIHLILFGEDFDRAGEDLLELLPTRIDLSAPGVDAGSPGTGAVFHAASAPGPVHFSTGYEGEDERFRS
ncbi:SAV_2336 N-terminal domain-related protein [Streptomyces sp. NPDC003023]|uniref:SAV_2336 N-terminal domain-related protein n=1 Tax=Streptomyces sp. NPDC003023 TaxID=3364675 RepID=UPI00368A3217